MGSFITTILLGIFLLLAMGKSVYLSGASMDIIETAVMSEKIFSENKMLTHDLLIKPLEFGYTHHEIPSLELAYLCIAIMMFEYLLGYLGMAVFLFFFIIVGVETGYKKAKEIYAKVLGYANH